MSGWEEKKPQHTIWYLKLEAIIRVVLQNLIASISKHNILSIAIGFVHQKADSLPHGWHTLDIECEGVLSIGV